MGSPREVKTPAVVIRRARLKEADRVIIFFTRDLGKVAAVAKGVRKAKSKLAGHLETLTYTDLTLARGKNLDVIIGSQAINPQLSIRESLERTAHAMYFAELVYQFAPEGQANPGLFDLLVGSLEVLGGHPSPEFVSRFFELNLLKNLGYKPELRRCPVCGTELQAVNNYFAPASGGILCPSCAAARPEAYPVSVSGQKAMRYLLENNFETASRLIQNQALNREIGTIIRGYIYYLLEKSVKSAAWLDELKLTLPANQ